MYGREPDTARMHFHFENRTGDTVSIGKYFTDPGLLSGWHRFAIDWRPGRLTWRIDGVRRWRVTGDMVPDERMYVVLNLAVGGERAGPVGPNVNFPKTFAIDYLRVWR
jgi:beta-glucanase (GH16 family)